MNFAYIFVLFVATLMAFASAGSIVFLAKPQKPRKEHQQNKVQHHRDEEQTGQ
ncbi:hypothetical protein ACKWTF_009483 [Chironomus riparius]